MYSKSFFHRFQLSNASVFGVGEEGLQLNTHSPPFGGVKKDYAWEDENQKGLIWFMRHHSCPQGPPPTVPTIPTVPYSLPSSSTILHVPTRSLH